MILVRTLYEIATYLADSLNNEVLFYISEIKKYQLLPESGVEVRWLEKEFKAEEVPEADIIICFSYQLVEELNKVSRGKLVFFNTGQEETRSLPDSIQVIDFSEMKPIIPESVFRQGDSRKEYLTIAGDYLEREELIQILKALDKAAATIPIKKIVVLGVEEEIIPLTDFDIQVMSLKDPNIQSRLHNSFYLIWVSKKKFPILPYWAMAGGTLVININLGNVDYNLPITYNRLQPVEIALEMIRLFKIGQYRKKMQLLFLQKAREYKQDVVGDGWNKYLEDLILIPKGNDEGFVKPQILQEEESLVDLIIINYNTLGYLKKCLSSIKEYTKLPYRIIVVDNGSTDGSKNYLKNYSDIRVISNKSNRGYGQACNQGILAGNSQYIVLLNSDIEVTSGWLEPLVELAKEEDVAVVGPKMVNENNLIVGAGVTSVKDDFKPRGWKEPDGQGVYNTQEDVISVGGACYLIKRELLPILSLFDEGYFFYFEETDYSLRVREKGYRVVYCPDSRIIHHHEGSLKEGDYYGRMKRNKYFAESRKRFYNKWNEVIAGGEKRRETDKLVFAGLIPWDYRQQRPQHLVRNLAKAGYEMLYLNPVCDNKQPVEVEENVYVYSPEGYGTVIYNLKKGNEINIGRNISKIILKLGFENAGLIINAPYWTPLLKYWEYSLLIYDCIDNYLEFDDLASYGNWLNNNEENLLNLADLVLVTSKGLYDKKKISNDNIYLLPNAADTKLFNYQYITENKPEDLPQSGQIIGYYGAIANWFNVELVEKIASKFSAVNIVLIGEISTDIRRLDEMPNVYLLGEKPYYQLPDYLYYFDLAVIPFKNNKLTEDTDPVKLYEYLAAGKTVLTTELKEVEKYADFIEIAKDSSEFLKAVDRLLKKENTTLIKEERFKKVQNENWKNRANRIKELIHLAYYDLYLEEDEKDNDLKDVNLPGEIIPENFGKEEIKIESWLEKLKNWFSGEGG